MRCPEWYNAQLAGKQTHCNVKKVCDTDHKLSAYKCETHGYFEIGSGVGSEGGYTLLGGHRHIPPSQAAGFLQIKKEKVNQGKPAKLARWFGEF